MNNALPNPSKSNGTAAFGLAMRLGRAIGFMLLAYVAAWGTFAIYQYFDKYAALSGHFSDATAHFLAIVILVIVVALPARAVFRLLVGHGRLRDILVVLMLPMISWLIAMIPDSIGSVPEPLSGDPTQRTYFVQGRPVVWFSGTDGACPRAWNRSGNHPQTNDVLIPATPALVSQYLACLAQERMRVNLQAQVEQREREAAAARMREEQLASQAQHEREEAERREREAETQRLYEEELARVRATAEQAEAELESVRRQAETDAAERLRLQQSLAMPQQTSATSSNRSDIPDPPRSEQATLTIKNFDCVPHEFHLNGANLGQIDAQSERTFVVAAGASVSYMCKPGTGRCSTRRQDNFASGSQHTKSVGPNHCGRWSS